MMTNWQQAGWEQAAKKIEGWRQGIKEKYDGMWKRVESFSNDGDYDPSDWGMGPKGNTWDGV